MTESMDLGVFCNAACEQRRADAKAKLQAAADALKAKVKAEAAALKAKADALAAEALEKARAEAAKIAAAAEAAKAKARELAAAAAAKLEAEKAELERKAAEIREAAEAALLKAAEEARAKKEELAALAKQVADAAAAKLAEEKAKAEALAQKVADAAAAAKVAAEEAALAIGEKAAELKEKADAAAAEVKDLLEEKAKEAVELAKASLDDIKAHAEEAIANVQDKLEAPKGDCKAGVVSDKTYHLNGFDYGIMVYEDEEQYMDLPEGWQFINNRDEEDANDARKMIGQYKWGVDQLCLAPRSKEQLGDIIAANNALVGGVGIAAIGAGAAGSLAVAGGAGALGVGAVLVGASASGLAAAAVLSGGVVVAAAALGGAAVLGGAAIGAIVAKEVSDTFTSACFNTNIEDNEENWFKNRAFYVDTMNGHIEKQCGSEAEGLFSKKHWIGEGHFRTPSKLIGSKTRSFIIKKKSEVKKADDFVPAPLPQKTLCKFEFEPGMHANVPAGCAAFSPDDIGWDKISENAQVGLLCATDGQEFSFDYGDLMNAEENAPLKIKSFAELSYVKAGPGVTITMYANENMSGDSLEMDHLSESFIHEKWPGHEGPETINDLVRSFHVKSTFRTEGVNTCDEYKSVLFHKDGKAMLEAFVKEDAKALKF